MIISLLQQQLLVFIKHMLDQTTRLSDIKYKIVFLGAQSVGKSAIIQRFILDKFNPQKIVSYLVIQHTIGIDFLVKNVIYQGFIYRLQLWDTAGQEKYRSLISNYVRDADCAVFVYDITQPDSFHQMEIWVNLFRNLKKTEAIGILVGNKSDMNQDRRIVTEDAIAKSQAMQLNFYETSALNGKGIEELFVSIIENIRINKQRTVNTDNGNNSDVFLKKQKIFRIQQKRFVDRCCTI